MSRLRPSDRWVHWATLLALVLATLAPGVSHALRHQRGDTMPWSELCSANGGMRRVQLPVGPALDEAPHAFEYCSACGLHLQAAPPPSAPSTAVARGDLAHQAPAALLHAPRTLHAWSSALARAPPNC